MNWKNIWDEIVDFFHSNLWQILYFFAVLFFGVIAVKLIVNIMRRILKRTHMEPIAVGFLVAILKFLLYLTLIMWLLNIVGIGINGIVTAFSAAFLAIGLALQNNIANLANGIIIVSSKMFKKGDYIEVDGVSGSITQINFLYVTIITPDNKRITLPNTKLVNDVVTNYDSNNTRRVNFEFDVAYENDVEKVKQVVIDCMRSNGLVRLDPAPFCRLKTLSDSNLTFVGRCWCDREDYWTVYFDITETVYNEFKRNHIDIAYNQLEIRERKDHPVEPINGTGLPARQEKVRVIKRNLDLETADLADIFPIIHKDKKKQKNTMTVKETQAVKSAAAQALSAKTTDTEQASAVRNNHMLVLDSVTTLDSVPTTGSGTTTDVTPAAAKNKTLSAPANTATKTKTSAAPKAAPKTTAKNKTGNNSQAKTHAKKKS